MVAEDRLAIVMAHTGRNLDVLEQNRASFARHNPNATIFLSTLDYHDSNKSLAWSDTDLPLIYEFKKHPNEFDKWLYVEWDCFCAVPVSEFFKETWSFDVVSTTVPMPYRECSWHWFGDTSKIPDYMVSSLCGVVPLAITLFSNRALKSIVEEYERNPFSVISELRIGTLANYLGYCPVPNPRANHVSWKSVPGLKYDKPLIYHPVKTLIENA